MSSVLEQSPVVGKTLELCASLASDPAFLKLHASVETFLGDNAARLQYQSVHEKGEELHHKQHAGVELGASEIREFEAAREALMDNSIARDFLSAQRELENLQKEITQYINATFELGRVPTEDDMAAANSSGCCGGNGGGGGCCS